MNKKYAGKSIGFLVGMGLFLSAHVCAMDPKPSSFRTVVVDSAQVMTESTAVKDVQQQIEVKRGEYQKAISKQEEELRKEHEKLMAEQGQQTPTDFEKKQKAFEAKVEKVKTFVEKRRQELEAGYTQALAKINDVFMKVVQTITTQKQANIALQRQMVIFMDPSMDITTEVVAALNKELSKVPVVFATEAELSKASQAPTLPISNKK